MWGGACKTVELVLSLCSSGAVRVCQAAVWRDSAGRRLVVAFRGTEQTKLKDLLTDIALAPAGFNPERAGDPHA